MPLKLTVAELSEVPEALRSIYRQSDAGGFILDVEGGVVAKSALDTFRQNNIELSNKLKALGDLTPDQVKLLKDSNAQLNTDLEAARKGKDKEADSRIAALTEGHTKTLNGLTTERDQYKSRLESVVIDGQVAKFAVEIGAHATALDDITARVRPQMMVGDDNVPYMVNEKREKVFGEDGKTVGVDGAVRRLVKTAPHLFKPSTGGGAAGGKPAGGGSNTTGNPWAKGSFNLTEQMRIQKSDSGEAARLKAEAGAA